MEKHSSFPSRDVPCRAACEHLLELRVRYPGSHVQLENTLSGYRVHVRPGDGKEECIVSLRIRGDVEEVLGDVYDILQMPLGIEDRQQFVA